MIINAWHNQQGLIGDRWRAPDTQGGKSPDDAAQEDSAFLLDQPQGLRALLLYSILDNKWPSIPTEKFSIGPAIESLRIWCIRYFLALRAFGGYPDILFTDDESSPNAFALFSQIHPEPRDDQDLQAFFSQLLDDPFLQRLLPRRIQGLSPQDFIGPNWTDPTHPASFPIRTFNDFAVGFHTAILRQAVFLPFETVFPGIPYGNWDYCNLTSPRLDKNGWPQTDISVLPFSMPAAYIWADGVLFQHRDKLPAWNAAIHALNYLRKVDRKVSIPFVSYLGFGGDNLKDSDGTFARLEAFIVRCVNRMGFARMGVWNPNELTTPEINAALLALLQAQPSFGRLPAEALSFTPFDADTISCAELTLHYSDFQ